MRVLEDLILLHSERSQLIEFSHSGSNRVKISSINDIIKLLMPWTTWPWRTNTHYFLTMIKIHLHLEFWYYNLYHFHILDQIWDSLPCYRTTHCHIYKKIYIDDNFYTHTYIPNERQHKPLHDLWRLVYFAVFPKFKGCTARSIPTFLH